jgi:hypothetical protein
MDPAGQYALTHDFIIAGLQKAAPPSVYLGKLEGYELRVKKRSGVWLWFAVLKHVVKSPWRRWRTTDATRRELIV